MKKPKILTNAQALELRWFCQNVTDTRHEYYNVMELANRFDRRLERLEKTCALVEKYFAEQEALKEAGE